MEIHWILEASLPGGFLNFSCLYISSLLLAQGIGKSAWNLFLSLTPAFDLGVPSDFCACLSLESFHSSVLFRDLALLCISSSFDWNLFFSLLYAITNAKKKMKKSFFFFLRGRGFSLSWKEGLHELSLNKTNGKWRTEREEKKRTSKDLTWELGIDQKSSYHGTAPKVQNRSGKYAYLRKSSPIVLYVLGLGSYTAESGESGTSICQ